MADPFAAFLAIPPAIDAAINITNRIKISRDQNSQAELNELQNELDAALRGLKGFMELRTDLYAWKNAHHITNNLIHSELSELILALQKGYSHFSEFYCEFQERSDEQIRVMSIKQNYSIVLIRSLRGNESINLEIGRQEPQFQRLFNGFEKWYDYVEDWHHNLIVVIESNSESTKKAEYIYECLTKLLTMLIALNTRADDKMKDGLRKLLDTLGNARS